MFSVIPSVIMISAKITKDGKGSKVPAIKKVSLHVCESVLTSRIKRLKDAQLGF